jgi:hypothetical protein
MTIIQHFDKYTLFTQKRTDYMLFKQVIELIINKEHLTTDGLQKIVNIKSSMNFGPMKSTSIAVSREEVKQDQLILDYD